MELKLIISEQPKCITCNLPMLSWNPFADTHEHVGCTADRISDNLLQILKKELNKK